jgi:hypothetical protein
VKTHRLFARASFGLLVLLGCISQVRAEITVRLSVKFIQNSDGTRPSGNISTSGGFDAEITRGNQILAATGRAYKLQVVEYLDIRPPAPAGSNANYWFTLPARANRAVIEAAALADMATWNWNGSTINMFVNNSSSGQCSFVGSGTSISFGGGVGAGTVLHEVGHFFDLRHTHANDYTNNTSPLIFTLADLADGDGLVETALDNPNITNNNQLCVALFNKAYTNASAGEQVVVDSAYENVMSYHNENVLLPVQLDIWTLNGNGARQGFCSGRTWFVANEGSDGDSGDNAGSPFATLSKGLSSLSSGDDVILLRAGDYYSPAGGLINTRCTLSATRGAVSIRNP